MLWLFLFSTVAVFLARGVNSGLWGAPVDAPWSSSGQIGPIGVGGLLGGPGSANGGEPAPAPDPQCPYTRANNDPIEFELERLYGLALKESRTLQSLEGGDELDDMDGVKQAFEAKFRCIKLNLSIDLSKYHEVRIDSELRNLRNGQKLTFDVAHLQTVHDFYRWKSEKHLLQFKPMGSEWVYDSIKDKDGHFTALNLITFSHYAHSNNTTAQNRPTRYVDYLNPRWKGGEQIVLTYPHDDDAVLFQFDQAMQQDPRFVEKLMAQEPKWVRGTGTPLIMIDQNIGNATVTFTTAAPFNNSQNTGVFTLSTPREPFLTWGQLAAIFKAAPNPNTAKLYLTWWLSVPQQEAWIQWSSRWDVNEANKKNKRLYDYTTNTAAFVEFMQNRKRVDELIAYMNRVIGPVTGPSPLIDGIRNVQ